MRNLIESLVNTRMASVGLLGAILLLGGCGGSSTSSSDELSPAAASDKNAAAAGTGTAVAGTTPASVNPGGVDSMGNPPPMTTTVSDPDRPTSKKDATRFLNQAGFGPTEITMVQVMGKGIRKAVLEQFEQPASRFVYTLPAQERRSQIHTAGLQDFCAQFASGTPNRDNCWRDWFSTEPLQWDFYRQAVANSDQLRQRVALSLGQIFVVSSKEVSGTYALATYHQSLRDNAFGNFRDVLQNVMLSPVMGTYLNMVNNPADDPNENFARELLQLFTLGTCKLNQDGTLESGKCIATYDNNTVREYAYALTGWTYPDGGVNPWCSNCGGWTNPEYFRGLMKPVAAQHDKLERKLLSSVTAPANRTPQQGSNAVVDSIMAHGNLAPFIGRQLIQFLVTSNPTPAYVARVSAAFNSGRFTDSIGSIGSGQKGDLKAALAAILLDDEARNPQAAQADTFGKLREPAVFMAGAIRAFKGVTDGERLGEWNWGGTTGQPLFSAPSVFNFYPPDFPLRGTALVGPQFGILKPNTALARINFVNDLVYWWYNKGNGLAPNAGIENSTGTKIDFSSWETMIVDQASDSIKVAEALNDYLVDGRLNASELNNIVLAMNEWKPSDTWLTDSNNQSNWKRERVKTAIYLILSSPHYQIQR